MSKRRIFHQRFTLGAISAIFLFGLLAFYLLWTKKVISAIIVVSVTVLIIERLVHTTYMFWEDDQGSWLTINRGRFSRNKVIRVEEIIKCSRMNTPFGFSHYLLIEFGAGKLASVETDNDEEFVLELNKRLEKAEKMTDHKIL